MQKGSDGGIGHSGDDSPAQPQGRHFYKRKSLRFENIQRISSKIE